MDDIQKNLKNEFERVIIHFQQEVGALRSSRPSPALVENLVVDCYQSKMPLKQVAAISILPPTSLRIEPWDKTVIPNIVQAISSSNLSIAPIVDNQGIRINLPPLSEERRGQLIKLLNGFGEKARIAMRGAREQANKKTESMFKDKEISEDDKFRMRDEVQKTTDEYIEKIQELVDKKEKELME